MNIELLATLLKTIKSHSDRDVSFHFIYNGDVNGIQIYVKDKAGIPSYFEICDTNLHTLGTFRISEAIQWIKDKHVELTKPKMRLVHGIEFPDVCAKTELVEGTSYVTPSLYNPSGIMYCTWVNSQADFFRLKNGLVYHSTNENTHLCKKYIDILLGLKDEASHV